MREGGTCEGEGEAEFENCAIEGVRLRDKASATPLYLPGTCTARIRKSPTAWNRARQRSRWPAWWSVAWSVLICATTAVLSEWHKTKEPDQEWLQMAAETTTGRSSLRAMEGRLRESGQGS